MKFSSLIFCIALACNAYSQFSEIAASKMYYERKSEIARVNVVNGELAIALEVSERRKFNDIVAPNYATEFVHSRSFSEISNLTANIAFPTKKEGKYSTQKVTSIIQKSEFSGSIFYNDDTYYEITFPTIEKGCYTDVNYNMSITDPHFFKPYTFSEYYPVEKADYTIIADSTIEFGWVLFGEQKDEVQFKKTVENGKFVYRWSLANGRAIKFEKNDPGYAHVATHLIVYVKKYKSGATQKTVLSDLTDLFNWYQELIGQIKPSNNDNLKTLTQQIIKDADTDMEKAQLIFAWVQDNIRYIAFEDGWRGFIPYPAAEICDKRYGDCKDMSHLLYEMMRMADLNVEHAWVGTRQLMYKYDETPCPNVDNHMITCLEIDTTYYLLDATDSYTPFGVPSSFILSKQVLFKGPDGKHRIMEVPEYDPEFCTVLTEVTLKDGNAGISGNASRKIETFEYARFHAIYRSANTGKENYLKEYLQLGPNNFKLISSDIKETKPREETTISYAFELPSYVKNMGTSSFINLNLDMPYAEDLIKEDRTYSYEIDYKKCHRSIVRYVLPEGKKVAELPQDISNDFSVGSCTSHYAVDGNMVVYERTVSVNKLYIEHTDFAEWNRFIRALQEIYSTSIELN